jgi:TRAP-type mannitol/chloroaromatic compound transport system substrate-binding protein
MMDIHMGNPCASELADLNASVQAMLEATWAEIREDLGDLKEVITSDCAIGVGQLVGGAIVIGGATVAGGEFIAAGGLVVSTAGTTLISGTAVGYVALGPDPAWTLVRITNFTLSAQQNLGACFS